MIVSHYAVNEPDSVVPIMSVSLFSYRGTSGGTSNPRIFFANVKGTMLLRSKAAYDYGLIYGDWNLSATRPDNPWSPTVFSGRHPTIVYDRVVDGNGNQLCPGWKSLGSSATDEIVSIPYDPHPSSSCGASQFALLCVIFTGPWPWPDRYVNFGMSYAGFLPEEDSAKNVKAYGAVRFSKTATFTGESNYRFVEYAGSTGSPASVQNFRYLPTLGEPDQVFTYAIRSCFVRYRPNSPEWTIDEEE